MAVYACTDLHGMYGIYEQIKQFIQPEDTVYFLGDACDRGPDGWKLINAILNDPQFVYLKGNHEEMFIDIMEEHRWSEGRYMESFNLYVSNGGGSTYYDWLTQSQEDYSYIGKLKNLPYHATYRNKDGYLIWLSHSGYPPFRNVHTGNLVVPERLALWDRDHCWVPQWGDTDHDMIIVHGHTPIPYFFEGMNVDIEIEPGALWYCEDHKVCLDNGTFATGYAVLFDLDTFDEHIFYQEVEDEEE